jgi:hypothetical protein
MANNKSTANGFQNKKQVKKELAHNIEIALPELKSELGEKKFKKRIKKAAKLITEGLHLKNTHKKKSTIKKDSVTKIKKAPVNKKPDTNKTGQVKEI